MHVVVIGAGSIGRRHIANLLSLSRAVKLTVVEPLEANRDVVREAFDILGKQSLEEALQDGPYDAALVCSPNHLHVSQAAALAEMGCHIFVEKPMSLNYGQAKSLARVLTETSVLLMVGCNLRFHPGVTALRHALEDGVIGRPLYARAQFAHYLPNWRFGQDYWQSYSANKDQGGGILLDSIHEPDYLYWLLGEVCRVQGVLARLGDLQIDVEDTADYVLWHGERLYSHVHVDYLRRDKLRGCEIVGTKGTVSWLSRGKNPESVHVELFDSATGHWETLMEDHAYDSNRMYIAEIEYFLDCLEKGQQPMNGVKEASHLMAVLDAVREASHSGLPREV